METNTDSQQSNTGAKPKRIDYNEIRKRAEELEKDPKFLYGLEELRIKNRLTAEDLNIIIGLSGRLYF